MIGVASTLCAVLASTAASFSLTPIGRLYASTDVDASAAFFQRYFGAAIVGQNLTHNTSCADVRTVSIQAPNSTDFSYTLTFVHDKVKPIASVSPAQATAALDEGWASVMRKDKLYSAWFDNHDGLGPDKFDIDKATADGLEMQVYHGSITQFPAAVVRLLIPGTSWTMECTGTYSKQQAEKLERHVFPDPDNCRNNSRQPELFGHFWWKSAFAAADPQAAAKFVVAALGAEPFESPFPWPRGPNCTAAAWTRLPGTGFNMHFVSSSEWDSESFTVKDWARAQEGARNLKEGIFDRNMYNAFVLWSDSLDDLATRLESLWVPYLALQLGPKLFALRLDVPGNGISIEVRGDRLTSIKAKQFDPCDSETNFMQTSMMI